jgi:hypothetical protein
MQIYPAHRRGYRLLIPLSITISLQTVNALSSDARKRTAFAISSGCPRRFRGHQVDQRIDLGFARADFVV